MDIYLVYSNSSNNAFDKTQLECVISEKLSFYRITPNDQTKIFNYLSDSKNDKVQKHRRIRLFVMPKNNESYPNDGLNYVITL